MCGHKSEVRVHSDEYYEYLMIQINNKNCETSHVDVRLSDLVQWADMDMNFTVR